MTGTGGGGAWPTGLPALRVAWREGEASVGLELHKQEVAYLNVPDGLSTLDAILLAHAWRDYALPRGSSAAVASAVLPPSIVLPCFGIPIRQKRVSLCR